MKIERWKTIVAPLRERNAPDGATHYITAVVGFV